MSDLNRTTAFVTGATGFLGGALVKRLASEGATIKALARRPNRDLYIRDIENLEIVMGNISDADRMSELVEGCDYVFHVAAATGGKLDYQFPANVVGTRNVANAAAKATVKRLIHVSSLAVYGYKVRVIVTEDTAYTNGKVPYNVTKAQAEQQLIEIGKQHSLSYTIVRPGMIFGPRSGMWTKQFFRLAKMKPTPFLSGADGTATPIYIDDVVDMLVQVATHPEADSEAFNCVIIPQATMREFIGEYQKLAGHQEWFNVPTPILKIIAPFADMFTNLRGEPQAIGDLIRYIESDVQYSMAKARNFLEWQPQVSLQEGIRRCIPYLQEKGLL